MAARWHAGHLISDPTIAVTRPELPGDSLRVLRQRATIEAFPEKRPLEERELIALVDGAHALICQSSDRITAAVVDAAPRLEIVSTVSVGFDHLDLAALNAAGILATNTPGVLTETTADMAWALILAARRRVVEGDRLVHGGGWIAEGFELLPALDVHGATLGIVGMGAVGQAVARRAQGFAMEVLYHSRSFVPGVPFERVSLEELLRRSDIVTLHVALNAETRGLIGERELGLMKPSSVLVNTSRGRVLDQVALTHALADHRIAAAGLDVTATEPITADDPILHLPNCIVLPHIASATVKTRATMADLAVEAVGAVIDGMLPSHVINSEIVEEAPHK
ncbi:MAG: D-glycerate dehydrogenase [Chloroflexi bacterium]|nr:MAG: D-glycerate dehydrogenase [Chloroflexota bacterium]